MDEPLQTAEQFAAGKFDLPDGGRWSELVCGEVRTFSPPDVLHGTAVLNLSKALADWLQRASSGSACFELGLVVARAPDTVLCPPISCFLEGDRFSEAEKTVTETCPPLVVEIASTTDRRREMPQRIDDYLAWGVAQVWLADTVEKQVFVIERGLPVRTLDETQRLCGAPLLEGFEIAVGDIFAEPDWWQG